MTARRNKAMTLAELILAVSITSVIGAAAATLTAALSSAHGQTDAMNTSIQSGRTAMMHMEATLRKARLICGTGDGQAVTWAGDLNEDGEINLNELTLFQFVSDSGTVEQLQIVFPPGMSQGSLDSLNVTIALYSLADPDDLRDAMERRRYEDYLTRIVLATGATDFDVVTDPAAPYSRLALLRLTVGPAGQQIKLSNAVHLRADMVGSIRTSRGRCVLELD